MHTSYARQLLSWQLGYQLLNCQCRLFFRQRRPSRPDPVASSCNRQSLHMGCIHCTKWSLACLCASHHACSGGLCGWCGLRFWITHLRALATPVVIINRIHSPVHAWLGIARLVEGAQPIMRFAIPGIIRVPASTNDDRAAAAQCMRANHQQKQRIHTVTTSQVSVS
jgi:hypothetical protein